MKYCFAAVYVFFACIVFADAQTPTPQPRVVTPRIYIPARDPDAAFDRLNGLEIRRTKESSVNSQLVELQQMMYRKASKEEIQVLAPAPHLLEKHAAFLRQSNTGIVKLNADSECVAKAEVIVAKENCLQYTMPGAGTAYSFRVESYRLPRLADLILSKNVLKTDGVLQQGIMMSLGKVPLEEVSLQTPGLKYMLDFKLAADGDGLLEADRLLSKGVKADGFVYGLGVFVKNQTTFVLRSVAYKGKFLRSVKGFSYNELDFDKRGDIVVAFRIIDKEANGNITIAWKLLSARNAPKLKADGARESGANQKTTNQKSVN